VLARFFFLVILGFELRALCLLLLEPCPQALFALVIFQIVSCDFAQGQP
jgi:hypothetical protein